MSRGASTAAAATSRRTGVGAFRSATCGPRATTSSARGICITASVASIPWLTGAFRGFLVGLLLDGELHRFTTYTGAGIDELSVSRTHFHLRLSNRTHRLELDARKAPGAVLMAPL